MPTIPDTASSNLYPHAGLNQTLKCFLFVLKMSLKLIQIYFFLHYNDFGIVKWPLGSKKWTDCLDTGSIRLSVSLNQCQRQKHLSYFHEIRCNNSSYKVAEAA